MLGVGVILAALVLAVAPLSAVAAPPANDDFSNASSLSEEVDSLPGNNFDATREAEEPEHAGDPGGASVWYAWTAPRSQRMHMQVCAEGWDALVGVYRGEALSGLARVASSSSASGDSCRRLGFRASAGVTYRIAVDGYFAAGTGAVDEGSFSLDLHTSSLTLPTNDSFGQATVVDSQTYRLIYGTTEGASREPGEPELGAQSGASVWYRWTAPQTGEMRLYPCLGDFDPVVGVYTGSSLAVLSRVGGPIALDSHLRDCQLGGLEGVAFSAVAGETYSIAVGSANGDWGAFQLLLQPVVPPYVDVYPPGTYVRKLLRGRNGRIVFQLATSEPGSTLLCRLDKRAFAPCSSPKAYRLSSGWHRFAVKAVDPAGNVDSTPAVRRFRVSAR